MEYGVLIHTGLIERAIALKERTGPSPTIKSVRDFSETYTATTKARREKGEDETTARNALIETREDGE